MVDDGSPGAINTQVCAAFPAVRSLRLPQRRGFCAAANQGIAAATGDVVELLNDDTQVTPCWAEAALVHFSDPRVVAVAPLVLQGPTTDGRPPRLDSAGDCYHLGGFARKRGHGQALTGRTWRTEAVFGASASSSFYRRDILLRVGAFPESFGAYFEDVDLSFRLHRIGGRVVFEPAARVWHRLAGSYGAPSRRLLEQQSRNEERVFWRNLPRAALLRALPWHVAVLAGKACKRWQEGNLAPFLWGRLGLLTELPELVRHRRELAQLGDGSDFATWGIEKGFGWRRQAQGCLPAETGSPAGAGKQGILR